MERSEFDRFADEYAATIPDMRPAFTPINNTVRGLGQLASRLTEVDALVLIRERTRINSQLLDKLPHLRMISQTGKASSHIDLDACTERGIAVLEGVGSPIAPAELTWALIMAAQRRIPQYVANLKQGAWQQSGLKTSAMPPNLLTTLTGWSRSSKAACGYLKSRSLARPLAPIGPRSGSVKGAPKFSHR